MPEVEEANRCFVDTNIWLYAFIESGDAVQRQIAKDTVTDFDSGILLTASELREKYSFSFWDSIIIASALRAGCTTLYTQDMQNGLKVDGQLTIVDPFA
ncbi:MAG: PIN domain-containing protein [Chloroflexi bacterium]|nr:PIN domain-containing protein [Chloroflexota bacterium]